MRTKFQFLAAGVALAACCALSGVAQAGTVDQTQVTPSKIYTLAPNPLQVGTTSTVSTQSAGSGTTTYDFIFDVDQTYGTTATGLFTISSQDKEDFTDANLVLFEGQPTVSGATYKGGVNFDPATEASQSISALLNPGDYFVQATVDVPAGKTGPFTVGATVKSVAAAPEPSTWLLLMVGVGALGMMLRRRRVGSGFFAA